PVPVAVDDLHPTAAIRGDPGRPLQHLARPARLALAQELPRGRERLDAIVAAVGHKDGAHGIERDALGAVEAPGIAAVLPPRPLEPSGRVEDLDAVVAGIGHEHIAGLADGDPAGPVELAAARPGTADHERRQSAGG